jgi:hypothetical protein
MTGNDFLHRIAISRMVARAQKNFPLGKENDALIFARGFGLFTRYERPIVRGDLRNASG